MSTFTVVPSQDGIEIRSIFPVINLPQSSYLVVRKEDAKLVSVNLSTNSLFVTTQVGGSKIGLEVNTNGVESLSSVGELSNRLEEILNESNRKAILIQPAIVCSKEDKAGANGALSELEAVVREGFKPVYDGIEDWLCDFWPGLPWVNERRDSVIKIMLADPRMDEIEEGFQQRYNFSIIKELAPETEDESDITEPTTYNRSRKH